MTERIQPVITFKFPCNLGVKAVFFGEIKKNLIHFTERGSSFSHLF